jgi:hypothetical protein
MLPTGGGPNVTGTSGGTISLPTPNLGLPFQGTEILPTETWKPVHGNQPVWKIEGTTPASSVAYGLVALLDAAAKNAVAGLADTEFNKGWDQCDKQAKYDFMKSLKGCCCCVIHQHMVKNSATGQEFPIWEMPTTGTVENRGCGDLERDAATHGSLVPVYNPNPPSDLDIWLNKNLKIPLPSPPSQSHPISYIPWNCP